MVKVNLDDEVVEGLQGTPERSLTRRVNDLLRLAQAFGLVIPGPMNKQSSVDDLEAVLATAKREIVFLDGALVHIVQKWRPTLLQMATTGVAMTFIVIDPSLPADDALYEMLERQIGNRAEVDDLVRQADESVKLLRELRDEALQSGKSVRFSILGCRIIPACGLIIPDPVYGPGPSSIMRITILADGRYRPEHTHLTVKTNTAETTLTYWVFHTYYEGIRQRKSRDLTDPPSS